MAARRKASPKVTKEVDEDAVIAAQKAALHLPIIVGEREGERSLQSICSNREFTYRAGEPNYKKPNGKPASPRSPQQPSADPEDDHRTRRIPLAPRAVPDVAEEHAPLPEGAFRPCVGRLQETLLALDEICMRDGRIRVQVEEIGRLLAVIRRTESEVVQKVRDVQRTRVAVENMFASRVKTDPALSLLGRPHGLEPEGEEEGGRGSRSQPEVADSEEEVRYGADFSDCWYISVDVWRAGRHSLRERSVERSRTRVVRQRRRDGRAQSGCEHSISSCRLAYIAGGFFRLSRWYSMHF